MAMALALVGVNHKTAPVDVRERLSVPERDLDAELEAVRGMAGVDGVAIVSTCNRVEIVTSLRDENVVEGIVGRLASRASMERSRVEQHLYILRHGDVVRHLFRVASGLDSMIVGEPQIAGQVRQAYHAAAGLRTLDPILRRLWEQTLRVAKKVRSETGIGDHAVSVPYAAVELARKIFGDLAGLRVLLVGAGKIGELTARNLQGSGLETVFVANRAFERAEELAAQFGGSAVHFDSLPSRLVDSDIVIASTAAPHYVIRPDEVAAALARRRRRDLFLVDLSVPRNIDPDVAKVEGAYLYNVDDLREIAGANREIRLRKSDAAEKIIEREVASFLERMASEEAIPTILELRERLETIRAAELEKCLRRIGPVTTEQRAAIEMLSSGIINKVLHYPIVRLKESAARPKPEGAEPIRDTIRRIFGLR
ncbi:MAG TPA: glutamyl-tRNA reductase [Thermoanaerobaculia bacterium]|nr:glutamyl-tRNA reductase [Thermoanaerobaculia bacterium]